MDPARRKKILPLIRLAQKCLDTKVLAQFSLHPKMELDRLRSICILAASAIICCRVATRGMSARYLLPGHIKMMTLPELLSEIRNQFDGLNPPANEQDLVRLQEAVGPLSEEVLEAYRFSNGSAKLPERGDVWLPARLLPVDEAIAI